jgi:hypothetical protein
VLPCLTCQRSCSAGFLAIGFTRRPLPFHETIDGPAMYWLEGDDEPQPPAPPLPLAENERNALDAIRTGAPERLRANRSSFHTSTASNFLRWASAISLLRAWRDSFAPETPRSTYSPTIAHPRREAYSCSSDSCISGFCPLRVETRAYNAARVIGRVSCVERDRLQE